ncbi:hypothetical protein KEM60_02229 [Austwickia sp. TVS 96-490-7B]|uniref:MvdC/MvdD family ATP grasp protein n=1 Tax=Austwickia sp. TVS 96-490-7B TaxID=2830843 RepID=UPI001C57D7A7|nr:hypothetical protein [Austwickia sp. TVS 96-490-7B]MBW3086018.1 hypothetical protein [Austwickia sp. TVS 96-490-7B]
MIGIVSSPDDLHAQVVRDELDARGAEHVLIDTGSLPAVTSVTVTQHDDTWSAMWDRGTFGGRVDVTDLHAMWWRRPQPFDIPVEVSEPIDRDFARGECAAFLTGLWSCLDARWVNDPDADEAASRKMRQLKVAASLGLDIPRTCMTSDPAVAREFIDVFGGVARDDGSLVGESAVIFKPFSATEATWRETRPVRTGDLALLDGVRCAPVIFQEYVGGADVRVTVVGEQVFAAATRCDEGGYPYDFRVDPDRTWSVHQLPEPVAAALLGLHRALGIWYGAVDLRLTPQGRYVFLEVNPAGQWLFTELPTGLEISAALADLLVFFDRGGTRGEMANRCQVG